MKRAKGNGEKGFLFIMAVFFIAIITIYGMLSVRIATSEISRANKNMAVQKCLYIAEAALEKGIYSLSHYIADNLDDPPDPPDEDAITGSVDIADQCTGSYECSALGPERTFTDFGTGVNTYEQNYLLKGSSSHSLFGQLAGVRQIIGRQKTYVFQYAIFYTHDLEVFPGRNMSFAGRIHSNGDIYIGADGEDTVLTVDTEYFRSAGQIFGYRKYNHAYEEGNVSIKVKGTGNYELMRMPAESTLDCADPDWETESQVRWNGTVKSSIHDVGTLKHPLMASIQPGDFYWANAGIYIINNTIFKRTAVGDIQLVQGVDVPLDTVTVTSGSTSGPVPFFRNQREAKYIMMTNIDMRKLAGYNPADPEGTPTFANFFPQNGLLYATRNDVPVGMQGGVRLMNGAKIYCKQEDGRNVGITLVTNLPVYIQGDYNKDDIGNGFVKKPCAVICDSLNILSNNWNDANSNGQAAARTATETEVNCAFVSGIKATAGGIYSGGLENYPRLHENWSGIELNIKGAFAELWYSSIATGIWRYGTVGGVFYYTAPIRNWFYDTDFNDNTKLPPFTPFALGIEKQVWWR